MKRTRGMVMKRLLRTLLVLSPLLSAGCGTVILKADFQNAPSGGLLPGKPDDDHVLLSGNVVFSGSLILHSPPASAAAFFSRPVEEPEATKTIFWKGRLKSGDGPIIFWVFGQNAVGGVLSVPPWELEFTSNEVKVSDTSSLPFPVLHSHSLNQNGEHEVFLSFRLKSGTFWFSIQQPGAPEIVFTGPLNPLMVSSLKDHSRLVLSARLASTLGSSATSEYEMDDVIMREK